MTFLALKFASRKGKANPENLAGFRDLLSLAPTGGFEPLACRLGGGRSILLSYVGIFS